ncbi:MAG: hypothetical protein WAK60_04965 [Sedimentisphaerales bacterium]
MRENLDLLFGLLFVGCWFFYLKLLSIYTGWTSLGKEFGFKGKFTGRIFHYQKLGGYAIHHIGLNDEGLYLALFFPFRPFHKPLFIPWKRIKFLYTRRPVFSGYYITVDGYAGIKFFLPDRTYERVADYIPVDSKPISVSTGTGF